MKRIFLIIMSVLMIAGILCGCGASGSYKILQSRELKDQFGQTYTILVPDLDDSDEDSYSYSDHGIYMSIYISKLYLRELDDILIKDSESTINNYKESNDYSNVVEGDSVKEDDVLYKICTADYLERNNSTSKETYIFAVLPKEDEYILELHFEFSERDMDSETNAILEELEKAYHIPLSDYKIDENKLTQSGKQKDSSIEDYTYDDERDIEVFDTDEYELLGKFSCNIYDDTEIELFVPMGKETYTSDYGARSTMHGVYTEISIAEDTYSFDLTESMAEYLEEEREELENYEDEYQNISEISLDKDNTEFEAMGSFTYETVKEDGSIYNNEKIVIALYDDSDTEGYFISIEIELNQADFDNETELLIQEINSAYKIDCLKLSKMDLK